MLLPSGVEMPMNLAANRAARPTVHRDCFREVACVVFEATGAVEAKDAVHQVLSRSRGRLIMPYEIEKVLLVEMYSLGALLALPILGLPSERKARVASAAAVLAQVSTEITNVNSISGEFGDVPDAIRAALTNMKIGGTWTARRAQGDGVDLWFSHYEPRIVDELRAVALPRPITVCLPS